MLPAKVVVWWAISAHRIVEPNFINQSVKTAEYRRIFMKFLSNLEDVEVGQEYFNKTLPYATHELSLWT